MKKIIGLLSVALLVLSCGTQSNEWTATVKPLDGEYWWGAVVNKGYLQPYTDFSADDNYYLDDPEYFRNDWNMNFRDVAMRRWTSSA